MEEQRSGRKGDVARVSVLRARIADRVADAIDPDDILRGALEVICEEGGWAVGHAWVHVPSGAQLLPAHLWYPRDDSFLVFRRASDSRRFEPRVFGQPLPGRFAHPLVFIVKQVRRARQCLHDPRIER